MAAFIQNIILGRKRKSQNDLQCFRRQSKARRLLTMEDENGFGNILGAFIGGCTKERRPKGQSEQRSSHWWRNGCENWTDKQFKKRFRILSLVRVTILLFVYGYYVSKKILMVALTTFASTAYLISKAFVFDFEDSSEDDGSRPVDYFLHIGSFMLVWVEAWYMQVKVLPKERKAAASILSQKPRYGSIKPPLSSAYSVLSFHTPPEQDSEEEEEVIRANLEYIEIARKATSRALRFLYAEKCWNIEKQKDDMLIESTMDEKLGKILRMRACINASQQVVHPMVFGDSENVKKWNTNITHAEIIQKVNSTTDICYSSIAEVAGGLISARDFVTVNHYQRIGEMYMSSSTSVVTPIKPPVEGVIRGETILNSYALLPAEHERDKSEFVWIATTALKPGSIPQVFVDRGMIGFLIDCVTNLKKECEQLKDNANTPL